MCKAGMTPRLWDGMFWGLMGNRMENLDGHSFLLSGRDHWAGILTVVLGWTVFLSISDIIVPALRERHFRRVSCSQRAWNVFRK